MSLDRHTALELCTYVQVEGIATIEATEATASVKVSALAKHVILLTSQIRTSYHAIDMLSLNSGKKYTLATSL